MGNKFTQSVLQRLEQEQKAPTPSKSVEKFPDKKSDYTPKPVTAPAPQGVPDITEYLRMEPARSAKNKTFYLDVEVIDALCAAARRQKVTDSKLCNDILRRVLGIGITNA